MLKHTLALVGLTLSLSANAATITAFSEIVTSSVTDTLSPPAQTSGSIDIEATNGAANPIVAQAKVAVTGQLFVKTQGSYVGGVGDSAWDSISVVTWSESFTNTTGADQSWTFDYLVLAGSLEMSMMSGADATGSFELNIALDGSSLTSSSVSLTPGSFVETGTGFGGTFDTPTAGQTNYSWDEYTDSLLFTVSAFSTSTLTYSMKATESVNITNPALECPDTATSVSVCSTGFIGGDPFDTTSVIVNIAPSAVPVPAAAWLFGSALVALAGIKRKAKK